MKNVHKAETRRASVTKGTLIGSVISVVSMLLLTVVSSILIVNGQVQEEQLSIISPLILLVSAMTGSYVGLKLVKEKILPVCIAICAAFIFVLAAVCVLVFDGGFGSLGIAVLSVSVGGAIACVLGTRKGRKHSGVKRRSR